eukprot:321194-Amphidinium_carterae.1
MRLYQTPKSDSACTGECDKDNSSIVIGPSYPIPDMHPDLLNLHIHLGQQRADYLKVMVLQ